MSRKRSHEMLQSHRERFLAGAMRHVGAEHADGAARVGDGRGLRRLRLPQGPQRRVRPARLPVDMAARPLRRRVPVRAANEQPMGFYAPDSLVHEAENRGIAMLGLDVNTSQARCEVRGRGCAPRSRLHQGRGRRRGAAAGGRARARARSPAWKTLQRAPECRRRTLEQLAWSGACDGLMTGSALLADRPR